MGRLRVPELEPEAPVVRVEPPNVRDDADEAGELDGRRLVERLRRDERRPLQLGREAEEIFEAAVEVGGRRAAELGAQAERPQNSFAEIALERHARGGGDVFREHLEADV